MDSIYNFTILNKRLVINRGDTVWQPDTFIQLLT